MSEENAVTTDLMETPPRVSEFKRFTRVFLGRKVVVFGLIVIIVLVVSAAFAPVLAPYDPYEPDLKHTLSPPSWEHLLGTDALGRDSLSRIIYGTRVSLMVGVIALGIASTGGMILGLIAGFFRGILYVVIMRFMDALMAFPLILLALAIAALLGGGLKNVMIALGIGLVPIFARLMCGQVLAVKESEYITAAYGVGASNLRIILFHILPNSFPPLIVLITLMMGMTILAEAGLSFLGIGVEPPGCAWGAMVSEGYNYFLTHPILSFAPGIAVILTVFAFNMVGDGLRDALDPRLRGTL